ncbi:RelA/SpoT domain-containing protein [Nocardioides aestuarii]|uniref:RelA/SpoT domain-containing protein n=1 Tax=Nocardioides aestuarii TaxID=252231 RepID=A0ABW4TJK8_9ACTN
MSAGELTTSQVKKAGRTVRRYIRNENISEAQLQAAIHTIDRFRAAHQKPLVTANNGLRSMVRSEGCVVEVSQRLKRFPTIIDKLVREPTLPLSSMQDIGGCRAILADVDEVRRVEARLKKRRPPVGYADYINTPRSSGYRGIHVVVDYGGRHIEVQLRTKVMHEWAIAVERLSARVGDNLKQDGEHALQLLMSVISDAMAIEEAGGVVPEQVHSEIARRRLDAAPYLGRNT